MKNIILAASAALACVFMILVDANARGRGLDGKQAANRPQTTRPAPSRPQNSRPTPNRPTASRPQPARPSGPSLSRPVAQRPNSTRPTTRPSTPSPSRPQVRPSNPNISQNTRPSTSNPTRPPINTRPSLKPQPKPGVTKPGIAKPSLPTTRPGIETRPGVTKPGTKPGIVTRPENPRPPVNKLPEITRPSQRPSLPEIADRPGLNRPGDRPTTRPGTRPEIDRPTTRPVPERPIVTRPDGNRPNQIRPDNRLPIATRLTVTDRRDRINDRMRDRDRWDRYDRDVHWRDRHDHWDRWHNVHYHHHHHWHHGTWHRPWRPNFYWNYWWDRYPVLTTFGVTTWAVNRTSWAFGYTNYYNPYATTIVVDNSTYNYTQPLVLTPDEQSLSTDPTTAPPPSVSTEALTEFDQARQQFFAGDYDGALQWTDAALQDNPNDAVMHEFRALTLFALGRYQESAAVLYAVLSVGPGWDWTTMSGLYPSVDVYTVHLRGLEAARSQNPTDPAIRLVLAYHYLTAGHDDAAVSQLKRLLGLSPEDQLARQMLLEIDPEAEIPDLPKPVEPPKPDLPIEEDALIGVWTAQRDDAKYTMNLREDGTYLWSFERGDSKQEIAGVWGVDDEGVLALEMNDEGAMLAQVLLKDNLLEFYMLGDTRGSEPLKFQRS